MFTGIIEEIGTVEQIRRGRSSAVLAIRAKKVLSGAKTGDSIAVNGVCLTVTGLFPDSFTADIMHETLNRSALSKLTPKSRVNLERAMPADGRFGGHIVAGHVDGVGKIVRLQRDDTAFRCTIQAPPEILRYIVEKGSVTVDGVSLTVTEVSPAAFSVSVIPHTWKQTVLQERTEGSPVNLETDIIGKYVEKLLRPDTPHRSESGITEDFLARCGLM